MSVIIPTTNRRESLRKCLESLTWQTYPHFQVIVVDGGSTDGTAEVIAEYNSKLRMLFVVAKGGLVTKMNQGMRVAEGDIFVRTDDDIVASREWLEAIVSTMNATGEVGGVTGPTIVPEERRNCRDLLHFADMFMRGNLLWRIIGRFYFGVILEGSPLAVGRCFKSGAFSLGAGYPQCLTLDRPVEVDYHEACNMAVKVRILRRMGGFDHAFTGIGEFSEPDISFKIRQVGYKILFNPRARVDHLLSRAGSFAERTESYGRALNFINFYFRHIRPNTVDKLLRFLSYLLLLNAYWVYGFMTTLQTNRLGFLHGTIVGLSRNMLGKTENSRRDSSGSGRPNGHS